ncbi:MAG: hypothetical protein ACOX88_06290 [Christensenellales bacterium]|jgi:hypothetical protein
MQIKGRRGAEKTNLQREAGLAAAILPGAAVQMAINQRSDKEWRIVRIFEKKDA